MVVSFPATLIVCETTSGQYGRSEWREEPGEPSRGSEGMVWALVPSDLTVSPCGRTEDLVGSLVPTVSPYLFLVYLLLFFLAIHVRL